MKDIALFKNIEFYQNHKVFTLDILDFYSQNSSEASLKTESFDVEMLDEKTSIAQAVLSRLLTFEGEITQIGHEDYGIGIIEVLETQNADSETPHIDGRIKQNLLQDERIQQVRTHYKLQNNKLELSLQVTINSNKVLDMVVRIQDK